MNDQRIAEICEKTDQIRAICDGYNVLNYGQLVEHINYLLSIVEKLNAQLKETRLERNRQEANKNYYKKQLAESQRREKAAVDDLPHICPICKSINLCKIKDKEDLLETHTDATGQCDKWQWRGSVDEEGEKK